MKTTGITFAVISALSAASATAQSLPDNMYVDGYLEITSLYVGGDNEHLKRASLNFGLTPNRENRFGVGFSLGIDAIDFDDAGTKEAVLYPAVTFALGNTGLLSVGVPRPVLGYGYIPDDIPAQSNALEFLLERSFILNSTVQTLYLTNDSIDMYGLRYGGEFGNTKIGASYHRLDVSGGGSDIDTYSIAFQHQLGSVGRLGQTKLFGGVEKTDANTTTITTYSLGAEAISERFRTGLILSRHNTFLEVTTANVYAEYKITDSFSVAGNVMHLDVPGSSENIYGLSAEYQFLSGGYVEATYADEGLFGAGELYEVSLGWRF